MSGKDAVLMLAMREGYPELQSLSGKLVESFVFMQLAAQLDTQDEPCHLIHYRDREQREIDFVIETPDGTTVGVEVKAVPMLALWGERRY